MDGKSRREIFAKLQVSQVSMDNNPTTDPAEGQDFGHNDPIDTQNLSMLEDTSLRDTTHNSVCISEGKEAIIEHMTTRLAELQEAIRGKEAAIESLIAKIKNAKYQQEFTKMQESYENLRKQVWVLPEQRLEEKEEHVPKLTEQIRNLQESMSRANSELERVNSEKKSLEKQLEDLRDKIRSKEADAEHKYQKLLEKNNQLQAECKQLMGGLQSAWNCCADKEQVLTRIANERRFGDSIGAPGLSRTLPRDNLVDDRNSTIGSEVKVSSFVDGIASTLNRYESMLKDCSKAADDNDQLREDIESLKLSVDAVKREKNELIEEIGKLRKEHEEEMERMKKAHRNEVQENASFKKASSSRERRRKKKISFTLDEEDQMNETIADDLKRDPDYTPRQHLEISPLPGPRMRSKSPVLPQPLVLQQPLPPPIQNTGTGTIREPIPSPAPAYLRGSVGPVGATGPSRTQPAADYSSPTASDTCAQHLPLCSLFYLADPPTASQATFSRNSLVPAPNWHVTCSPGDSEFAPSVSAHVPLSPRVSVQAVPKLVCVGFRTIPAFL